MKKRITALFLSFALVVMMLPIVSVPVSAAPSSGNVVQQMGGPVSSKFSLNIDDIIKNYASSKAYEARFYPFGEGEGMPVFIGTAHRVKDINKTDAEIAYLDAMEKAGTDEYSLKQFLNYVKKYEATCQTSAEVLQETIYDVAKTALSAAGFVVGDLYGKAGETVGNVVGAASFATGAVDTTGSLAQNGVNVDVIASIGFTLGDLAGLAGGVFSIGVLTTIGTVAAVGGVGYTMFQKYMEHQEQWKDFANYLLGRRNLVEFFKYLDAELKEVMKSGWDVQFNYCEYIDETKTYYGFTTPITYTFYGRFMKDYTPEFTTGSIGNTNEDGWQGRMELSMKADMTDFTYGWPSSPGCIANEEEIADIRNYSVDRIYEDKFQVVTEPYWEADLTCENFPLKTSSMDESQPQIVFEGSLADGSYIYRQGGEIRKDFHAALLGAAEYTYRSSHVISKDRYGTGIMVKKIWGKNYPNNDGYLTNYSEELPGDSGEIFAHEYAVSMTTAKMVIDLSKPLGGIKDNPNGEFYCSTCGAGLAPDTPCPKCSAGN